MNQEESGRLRREYEEAGINPEDFAESPMAQFDVWFSGAVAAGIDEPNAFVLSTSTPDGRPSGRAVLLKDADQDSFSFYTHLESRKSREMKANPIVAATFVWLPLHRQVRFEGRVEGIDDVTADAYFATRPRGAQVAAHSSRQSEVAANREEIESVFLERDASLGKEIPRPKDWGGWRVTPDVAEFWQGRPNRFHDRLRYSREGGAWTIERLQP